MLTLVKQLLGTTRTTPIEDGGSTNKHNLYSLEFNNLIAENRDKVFEKITYSNNYQNVKDLKQKFEELDLNYKYDLLEFSVKKIPIHSPQTSLRELTMLLEKNDDNTILNNFTQYIELENNLLNQQVFVSDKTLLFYIDNRTKKIVKLNVVDRRNKKHIFISNPYDNNQPIKIQDLLKDKKPKIFGVFQKPINFKKEENYYIVPAFVDYHDISDREIRNKLKESILKNKTNLILQTYENIVLPETYQKNIVKNNTNYILPLVNEDKNRKKFNVKYQFLRYDNNKFNITLPIYKTSFDKSCVYEGAFIKYMDKPELSNVICREIIEDKENNIIKIKSSVSRLLEASIITISDQEYYIKQNHYYITLTKPILKNIYSNMNYFVKNNINRVNCVLVKVNPNIWYIY